MCELTIWSPGMCRRVHSLVDGYQRFGETRCFHLQNTGTLKMYTVGSSDILLPIYQTTRRYIIQDSNPVM